MKSKYWSKAMTKKREHGDGGIDERGPNTFRLRYRLDGKRHTITFHGTYKEAKAKLEDVRGDARQGKHAAPDKLSLGEWVEHWLEIGAPGRKKKRAGRRTLERYGQLLRCHVVPTLGTTRIQQLQPAAIDKLYDGLEGKIAPRTQHHVHVVLGACLNAAVRKGLISISPIDRAEKVPSPGEGDHGQVLDEDQLTSLVQGFRNSVLYPIVAVAAFTGARRNEILALRWSDLDPAERTLRIERALEETRAGGRTLKEPKTARGRRTIEIDGGLLALLLAERDMHLRAFAGVPAGASVDLSLVRLPENALMFPGATSGVVDLTKLRNARAVTHEFCRQARKRGFAKLRFHDLREQSRDNPARQGRAGACGRRALRARSCGAVAGVR
jgi:integrase